MIDSYATKTLFHIKTLLILMIEAMKACLDLLDKPTRSNIDAYYKNLVTIISIAEQLRPILKELNQKCYPDDIPDVLHFSDVLRFGYLVRSANEIKVASISNVPDNLRALLPYVEQYVELYLAD